MGCAAGKHVTSSPEVSTSTHVATSFSKENGWSPLVSDNQRKSTKGDANKLICKGRDSSENKIPDKSNSKFTELENNHQTRTPDGQEINDNNSDVKKTTFKSRINNSESAAKPVPLGQIRVQITQSQVDFFRMLDMKINAGPDYISDADT